MFFYSPFYQEVGGAKRDRTADLYNAIVALSQLSYSPPISPGTLQRSLLSPAVPEAAEMRKVFVYRSPWRAGKQKMRLAATGRD